MQDILLSLGSNQGNSFENLQEAVNLIFEEIGQVIRISPVYKTEAWGFEGPDFLNCAILAKTRLSSRKALGKIQDIESKLGRLRNPRLTREQRYEDRPIDIDILFYADEVVETKKLTLPHPEMQNRLFVLQPLLDIAPDKLHPVLQKTVSELIIETQDKAIPLKESRWLKNPKSNFSFENYSYIAIEGNIGAGKTTLATMIAEDFNAKLILERFKDNPFLPKFYKDQARYAFPLEMSFLADRYQQLLDDIGQYDLFKDFMIADYDSYKSLIFAQVTLAEEEFNLYKKLHGMMYRDIAKPDLYVYLYQNTDRLLANIKKRGRSYEQDISEDYLIKINRGYLDFIKNQSQNNVRVIDISDMDFVSNRKDYLLLLKQMNL
ncbi:MAG: 2-amino-4-hydroxy-6-hydroxymethyldihydropteridine diphosphokinase [Leeuwenhoekiella sp.]